MVKRIGWFRRKIMDAERKNGIGTKGALLFLDSRRSSFVGLRSELTPSNFTNVLKCI
jgi:hypothetical protein